MKFANRSVVPVSISQNHLTPMSPLHFCEEDVFIVMDVGLLEVTSIQLAIPSVPPSPCLINELYSSSSVASERNTKAKSCWTSQVIQMDACSCVPATPPFPPTPSPLQGVCSH